MVRDLQEAKKPLVSVVALLSNKDYVNDVVIAQLIRPYSILITFVLLPHPQGS